MKKWFSLLVTLALCITPMLACVADGYTAGTYSAAAKGIGGDVTVEVIFTADAIESVSVTAHQETAGISDPAIERIPAAIVAGQTLAVDAVAGATITSNAILAAVEACAVQAGADIEALKTASAATEIVKTESSMETDVVVVGAGLAGLASAMSAADAGANVLLIDKMPAVGGSAALSSGALLTVNATDERAAQFDSSLDNTMNFWKEVASLSPNGHYPDYDFSADVLAATGATVDYLTNNGVVWGRVINMGYGVGTIAEGGGAGLIKFMEAAALSKGVNLLLECKAEELILDGEKVVGVKAATVSENLTITAKNVILATGGFSQNPDMLAEYIPGIPEVRARASASNTGDGMTMAIAAGAAKFADYWPMVSTTMLDPTYNSKVEGAGAVATYNAQLGVNGAGKRFGNEAASSYSSMGNYMIEDNTFPYYFIYDSSNPDLIAALEGGIALGEVVKADTAEALAAAAGLDAAAFSETFGRYNALCDAGNDEDFGKAADKMVKLTQAPYYAVKFYPTTIGTLGGVVTDTVGHVLREDGSIIDGLFAVGEMSNRMFYNKHYIGGASLALYSTMGLRAGAEAAK